MKSVEVENEGFMSNIVKSIPGRKKIGKTPLPVINAIFTYFVIPKWISELVLLLLKSKDSEVFKYV